VVRDVLRVYPVAASRVDARTGRLPIVQTITYGHSWEAAVGTLLAARPRPFGGDGGRARPDAGPGAAAHRAALGEALGRVLAGPEPGPRDAAVGTAGRLAAWGTRTDGRRASTTS
jgi:hypothetical protein